jgi:predicted component of type VI protein secretion system
MAPRIRLCGTNGLVDGRVWESMSILRAGRLTNLELVLNDSSVSRRHAEVRLVGDDWFVRDLGSTNGTFLNGTRLGPGNWKIRTCDIIRFGDVTFEAEIGEIASLQEIGIGCGPVKRSASRSGSDPISGQPSGPTFGNIVTENAPPRPGSHPVLWKVTIRSLAGPAHCS